MNRVSIFLISAFISLFVGQAAAHQPLPRVDWCSGNGMVIKIAGEFRFSHTVLESYKTCIRNGTCVLLTHPQPGTGETEQHEASGVAGTTQAETSRPTVTEDYKGTGLPGCRSAKDCGETNDDWMVGTRVASSFCSAYQTPRINLTSDVGSVMIHVTAPLSYNAADHHLSYGINSGLTGQCLRCELRR